LPTAHASHDGTVLPVPATGMNAARQYVIAQVAWPASVWYLPTSHALHADASVSSLYWPGAHVAHVAALVVAPVTVLTPMPAAQVETWHAAASALFHVPAAHTAHWAGPPADVLPAQQFSHPSNSGVKPSPRPVSD